MIPIVALAGGLATRLRPYTEKLPKILLPINGIPFLFHQIVLFKKWGISHIHLCLGYLGEDVLNALENWTDKPEIRITWSFDGEKLLGTGGSIKKSLPDLPDPFFVTYGDSYLDVDYPSIEKAFFSSDMDALMTVYRNENKFDTSNVVFTNNTIECYSKQHRPEMNYIDYGLGILQKKHFQPYSKEISFDLAHIYKELSRSGKLVGFEVKERFFEIGSFNGINDLEKHLKQTGK